MSTRVVITGVGVVSPLGKTWKNFSHAIMTKACAQRPVSIFDASTFGAPTVAEAVLTKEEIQTASKETRIDPLALCLDRKLLFGRNAACQAVYDAFGKEKVPTNTTLSLGMGLEVLFLPDVLSLYDQKKKDIDITKLPISNRTHPLRLSLDTIIKSIALSVGIENHIETFVSACASGTQCLGEAFGKILRNETRFVLAGATDSMINPMGLGCFQLLGALSSKNASNACRPFHQKRDGTIIGEGAAFFLVESLSSAKARSAKIYAEILGFATSMDAYRVTSPHPDGSGARRAMQGAMRMAKFPKIGYVNAHGTGTIQNDSVEINAIQKEIGSVPVGASKSQFGHAMAASGSLEILASLLCFTHNICAPTLHLDQVDTECEAEHVFFPKPFSGDAVLKNSFGFGGQNACLVLGGAP